MSTKPYLQSIRLRREEVADFSVYPFCIPAVRELRELTFHPDVTFLVGENGAGKSTLMEAIARGQGFSAAGGSKHVRLATLAAEEASTLHQHLYFTRSNERPQDAYFLRAESFYNIATYQDDIGELRGYGGKSLHAQSHGEAFMATLTRRLQGRGLYLLDEPEAALSPSRQFAALHAIHQLVKARSQFIIATHSPILLAYPQAKIVRLGPDGLTEVKYEDTEHFIFTRDFLNHHQRMLHHLLHDDAE